MGFLKLKVSELKVSELKVPKLKVSKLKGIGSTKIKLGFHSIQALFSHMSLLVSLITTTQRHL